MGDDTIGDFRLAGVAYDPIVDFADRTAFTGAVEGTAIYYERQTETYLQSTGRRVAACRRGARRPGARHKAYIDMPNQTFLNFFNPRTVYFGLRFNF